MPKPLSLLGPLKRKQRRVNLDPLQQHGNLRRFFELSQEQKKQRRLEG